MTKRLTSWKSNLVAYFLDLRTRKVVASWSEFSCGHFFGGAMKCLVGEDPHAEWEGKYSTAEEGAALLQANGYATYQDWVIKVSGGVEIPTIMAQFGDLAFVSVKNPAVQNLPEEFDFLVGVVEAGWIWIIHTDGLRKLKVQAADKVYRVS